MKSSRFAVRLMQTAAIVAFLGACSPQIDWNGQFSDAVTLAKIEPGKSSRATVQAILGGPSSKTVFSDMTWYYIGQQTKTVAFFPPEILQRQVIFISFNETGTVDSIGRLDLVDGKKVVFVDRTTPTAGQRITILQQLIGNLGRFAPEEAE